MGGPLGTTANAPKIDSGTMARAQSKPPRVTGPTAAPQHGIAGRSPRTPFVVHLDLKELIKIEQPGVGQVQKSGSFQKVDVFVKGAVLGEDADRPKKVLAIVQQIFAPLAGVMKIELDSPAASDRLLRARYGWPMTSQSGKPQVSKRHGQFYDPGFVGAGARAQSRSRLEKFKPVKGDANKGVTAYVFEGAIGILIMNFFGGKANVENIFAIAIAHELGHNLGLPHTQSPSDIMFVYANKSESAQKKWVTAAEKNSLKFSQSQLTNIRNLLKK